MSQGTDSPAAPQSGPATPPTAQVQRPASAYQVPATLVPESGWHFLHLFYRVDRAALTALPEDARRRGRAEVLSALGGDGPGAPEQLQGFAVVGHKADFGVVMAGPDLR